MRFSGQDQFDHRNPDKIGIVISNLGTPEAPTAKALRPYLKQFLSDRRVVEIPRPIWWLILNGIILNTRPKKSAKLYESVWTDRGSPLLYHTQDQASAIQKQLTHTLNETSQLDKSVSEQIIVKYAMRYGQPSIESTIEQLQNEGANKILVLPLYPQYSAATGGSTFDAVAGLFKGTRWIPDFRFISSYHDDENYINACAEKITEHWQQHGKADKLLLSYHGVPRRYLEGGDPYHCQCHKSSRLIAEKLGLNKDQYISTFQSRFGKAEWLRPYTDATLKELPRQGVKSVDVFCPGFSSDCLETLEEIAVENKAYFLQAGGEGYHYITALNSEANHINALSHLIIRNIQDWLNPSEHNQDTDKRYALAHRDDLPYHPKV